MEKDNNTTLAGELNVQKTFNRAGSLSNSGDQSFKIRSKSHITKSSDDSGEGRIESWLEKVKSKRKKGKSKGINKVAPSDRGKTGILPSKGKPEGIKILRESRGVSEKSACKRVRFS